MDGSVAGGNTVTEEQLVAYQCDTGQIEDGDMVAIYHDDLK